MRFRKSVSLMKGVKLNASKSGVSFTVGGKGISLNVGKKGVFLNTSIPGTGLYDRKRIDTLITDKLGIGKKKKTAAKEEKLPDFTMTLNDEGEVVIENEKGNKITSETTLRAIRQTEEYKETYAELMDAYLKQINAATEAFTHIYKLSADVSATGAHKAGEISVPKGQVFEEPKPTRESILPALEAEAEKEAERFPFYSRKLKKRQYVQQQMEAFYARALDEWEARKAAFEGENDDLSMSLPASASANEALTPDFIEKQIESWLSTLELPVDFSLQYDYDENSGVLWVDLDVPEIEDVPTEKAVEYKSGQVKAKEKSQKELRQDYVTCVFGLAVFFASYLFCLSPHIGQQVISGYTQRRDDRSGEMTDNYIYSIVFDRDAFEKGRHKKSEPYAFCQNFRNRVNLLATSELKTIEPYTPADLQ